MSNPRDDELAPTESLDGFAATSDALAETAQAPSTPGPVTGDTTLERGTRVGRYVIGARIGAGGMGVVYRAHDPELDRALAIKLVRTARGGSAGRARLLREAQAMAKLRHPNVVPIFDVGPTGDGVFVVMPCLEGGTLGEWVRAAPRPWREVIARFAAAGRGLVAAHAAGLVHRDFKPDNVLLDAEGTVEVADFGLARIDADELPSSGARRAHDPREDLTRTGDVLGTPAYMAPEQMRGEPSDARADQFSFCVALWEALYGRRPFDAGTARGGDALRALLDQIVAEQRTTPTSGRDVPGWVRAALDRGLRPSPADRWPSMQALLGALGGPPRRRGAILAAAGAAVIAGGVAIAVVASSASSSGGRSTPPDAAPGPIRVRLEDVSSRSDVLSAALSPDGTRLAVIGGGQLRVSSPTGDGEDTMLVDGVLTDVLAWSPDGTKLLVAHLVEDAVDHGRFGIVEAATGAEVTLPFAAMNAAFATETELVVSAPTERRIWWQAVDADEPSASCEVPGEYTFIDDVTALGADAAVVTVTGEAEPRAVIIDRDCHVHGTISPPGFAGVVVHRPDAILTLATGVDSFEIQAWSRDGAAIGAPRIGQGSIAALIGRVGDRDLVLTGETRVSLVRRRGAVATTLLTSRSAKFAFAPDGRAAWVEMSAGRGVLRVAAPDELERRGGALPGSVYDMAWSPDGKSLAVLDLESEPMQVSRVDLASGAVAPVGLTGTEATRPVWLDDHRIAAQRLDHSTYDWVDVDSGARGTVVDPAAGWMFELQRSPRDGTLAFAWNRGEGPHAMTLDAGGTRDLGPLAYDELLRFTPAGELLVFGSATGTISVLDGASKRRELARHAIGPHERLGDLAALADGELLLTIYSPVFHVAIAAPE